MKPYLTTGTPRKKVTLITEKYKEDSSRRSKFPQHFFRNNGGGIQTIVCYVREIPIFVFFGPLFISLRRLFTVFVLQRAARC